MSSRSDDCPVGWKPTGTPSSSIASQSGSNSGSWMWRAPDRVGVWVPGEGAPLEVLADDGRLRPLRHLTDLEVADPDDRLVRCVLRATDELRRERAEWRLQVALPEGVRLHRVEVAVHHPESVLHGFLSGSLGEDDDATRHLPGPQQLEPLVDLLERVRPADQLIELQPAVEVELDELREIDGRADRAV